MQTSFGGYLAMRRPFRATASHGYDLKGTTQNPLIVVCGVRPSSFGMPFVTLGASAFQDGGRILGCLNNVDCRGFAFGM